MWYLKLRTYFWRAWPRYAIKLAKSISHLILLIRKMGECVQKCWREAVEVWSHLPSCWICYRDGDPTEGESKRKWENGNILSVAQPKQVRSVVTKGPKNQGLEKSHLGLHRGVIEIHCRMFKFYFGGPWEIMELFNFLLRWEGLSVSVRKPGPWWLNLQPAVRQQYQY